MTEIPTLQELDELAEGAAYRRPATLGRNSEENPTDEDQVVEVQAQITDVVEVEDDLGRPAGHVVSSIADPVEDAISDLDELAQRAGGQQ